MTNVAQEFTIEGLGVTVIITESAGLDNAIIVFIDTTFEPNASDGGRGLRVLINDDDTYVGVPYRHDPTDDMDDEEIAHHNELMETDLAYRDMIHHERN